MTEHIDVGLEVTLAGRELSRRGISAGGTFELVVLHPSNAQPYVVALRDQIHTLSAFRALAPSLNCLRHGQGLRLQCGNALLQRIKPLWRTTDGLPFWPSIQQAQYV